MLLGNSIIQQEMDIESAKYQRWRFIVIGDIVYSLKHAHYLRYCLLHINYLTAMNMKGIDGMKEEIIQSDHEV